MRLDAARPRGRCGGQAHKSGSNQDGSDQFFSFHFLRQASIGSRVGKHWFIVQRRGQDMEQMMTISRRSKQCLIPLDATMKKAVNGLFLLLQHPYLQVR